MNQEVFEQDWQLKMARNHLELFRRVTPDDFQESFEIVCGHTMLPIERLYDLFLSVRYLDKVGIVGNVLEVGTWKGGALGMCLLTTTLADRVIFGLDTFRGHSRPEPDEFDIRGFSMRERWDSAQLAGQTLASADQEECAHFLRTVNKMGNRVELVQGDVKATGPKLDCGPLALLRVDCDWYLESRASLECFWPQLVPGGILILDDFGHHSGQKRAVEEFLEDKELKVTHVDYSCLSIVKPTTWSSS